MSIDSRKCVSPNRRQTIAWTDGDSFRWRIYASSGHNNLTIISSHIEHLYQYGKATNPPNVWYVYSQSDI